MSDPVAKQVEAEAAREIFAKACASGNEDLAAETMQSAGFRNAVIAAAKQRARSFTATARDPAGILFALCVHMETAAALWQLQGCRRRQLEARVAALESKPSMKYVGIYREGIGYEPGSVCTFDGSMWHAERTTVEKPGTSADWQLCVKHGRDLR